MRLSEPMEKSGFFWLPEDAENQVPAILRISKTGEVTLEVICFSDPNFGPYVFKERRLGDTPDEDIITSIDRIVGIIDDGLITLDDCFYVNPLGHWLGETSTSIIHAHFAFIGFHFEEGEEVTLSKLTFSVEGLDEWLLISGIRRYHNLEEKSVSIHFDLPQEIAFHLPDGIELKLTFSWYTHDVTNVTEARITQKAYISLVSEKLRPVEYFLDLVFKLHNFLCFAIDKTVSLDSIIGYSSEKAQIEVYYQSTPFSEEKSKIYLPDMLFSYRGLADQIEEILTKWLESYKIYEPAFNLYFASVSSGQRYMEWKFLSLSQGIETLHRRNYKETQMSEEEFKNLVDTILQTIPQDRKDWMARKLKYANELSLRKRIKQMIEPFKNLFGNQKKCRSFIDKVVDTRNYLTHYDSGLATKAASGEGLWKLCMKLEALFQLHFLQLIEMDLESIRSIVNENYALRNKLGLEDQEPSEESV